MELDKEQCLAFMGIQRWRYRLLEDAQGPWLFQAEDCQVLVAMPQSDWLNPQAKTLFQQWCFALNIPEEQVGVLNSAMPLKGVSLDCIFGEEREGVRSLKCLSDYVAAPQSKRELWLKTFDLGR